MNLTTRPNRTPSRRSATLRTPLLALVLGLLGPAIWLLATTGVGAAPQAVFARRDVILAKEVDFARVADLDGDDDLDFLAMEPATNKVTWWENQANGTAFQEHTITDRSNGVRVVSPGDVDNDGDVDVLTLSPARSRLGLWLNDGQGAFTEYRAYSPLVQNASHIEMADVNGDGFADFFLLLGRTNRIDWYENKGEAGAPDFDRHALTNRAALTGTMVRLDAGDVDGDGLLDFATANTVAARVNWWRHTVNAQGEHEFERQHPTGYREQDVVDVSVADADGDGDMDVFASRSTSPSYRVNVWLQEPDGFERDSQPLDIAPANRAWHSIDTGDINRDGAVDFIASELGGSLCWYENPGGAPVPTTPVPATATATRSATITPSTTPTPVDITPSATVTRTPTLTPSPVVTDGVTPTPSPSATDTPDATPLPIDLPRLEREG